MTHKDNKLDTFYVAVNDKKTNKFLGFVCANGIDAVIIKAKKQGIPYGKIFHRLE